MRINDTIFAVILDSDNLPASKGLIMYDNEGVMIDTDEEELNLRLERLLKFDARCFIMTKMKLTEV